MHPFETTLDEDEDEDEEDEDEEAQSFYTPTGNAGDVFDYTY